jgi:epoxyqueuosine reductase QueG
VSLVLNDTDQSDNDPYGLNTGDGCIIGPMLLRQGIETWALIGNATLAEVLDSRRAGNLAGLNLPAAGVSQPRGAIVVAFPYDPRPAQVPGIADQPGGPEPYLRVAAFAAFHYYAALTRLLKATARELAATTGHPYAGFRVAVNSGLPEKRLAELAGLGCRGRSDLLLSHAYGPACILGVLLLPFEPRPSAIADRATQGLQGMDGESPCGSCRACAVACPSQAIDGTTISIADCHRPGMQERAYQRDVCIQHWMSTNEEPPDSIRPAFTGLLYGCDACILACPLSTKVWVPDRADGSSPASRTAALLLAPERRPGTFISGPFLFHAGDDQLKAFFRKTALGLSWLGPELLRRNAALGSPGAGVAESSQLD